MMDRVTGRKRITTVYTTAARVTFIEASGGREALSWLTHLPSIQRAVASDGDEPHAPTL